MYGTLVSLICLCVSAPLDSLCDLDVPVIDVELGEILDECSWSSELQLDPSGRVESEEESESTALWHLSTHNPLLLLFVVLLLCAENIPDWKSHEKLHQHINVVLICFCFVSLPYLSYALWPWSPYSISTCSDVCERQVWFLYCCSIHTCMMDVFIAIHFLQRRVTRIVFLRGF